MRHLHSCLDLDEIKAVMSLVPGELQEVMKEFHLMLAGGFIRDLIAGDVPNDLDLWCRDSDRCGMAAMMYVAKIGGDMVERLLLGEHYRCGFQARCRHPSPVLPGGATGGSPSGSCGGEVVSFDPQGVHAILVEPGGNGS